MEKQADSVNSGEICITERDIELYAEAIGLDVVADAELMWIARKGIAQSLPPGWTTSRSRSGDIFYFDVNEQISTWEHPYEDVYRDLVSRELQRRNSGRRSSGGSRGDVHFESLQCNPDVESDQRPSDLPAAAGAAEAARSSGDGNLRSSGRLTQERDQSGHESERERKSAGGYGQPRGDSEEDEASVSEREEGEEEEAEEEEEEGAAVDAEAGKEAQHGSQCDELEALRKSLNADYDEKCDELRRAHDLRLQEAKEQLETSAEQHERQLVDELAEAQAKMTSDAEQRLQDDLASLEAQSEAQLKAHADQLDARLAAERQRLEDAQAERLKEVRLAVERETEDGVRRVHQESADAIKRLRAELDAEYSGKSDALRRSSEFRLSELREQLEMTVSEKEKQLQEARSKMADDVRQRLDVEREKLKAQPELSTFEKEREENMTKQRKESQDAIDRLQAALDGEYRRRGDELRTAYELQLSELREQLEMTVSEKEKQLQEARTKMADDVRQQLDVEREKLEAQQNEAKRALVDRIQREAEAEERCLREKSGSKLGQLKLTAEASRCHEGDQDKALHDNAEERLVEPELSTFEKEREEHMTKQRKESRDAIDRLQAALDGEYRRRGDELRTAYELQLKDLQEHLEGTLTESEKQFNQRVEDAKTRMCGDMQRQLKHEQAKLEARHCVSMQELALRLNGEREEEECRLREEENKARVARAEQQV